MSGSDFSPVIGFPYLLSNQSMKHVTVNESLRLLDGLVHLSVQDRVQTAPPGSVAEGDRYLIASSAAGDWSGHDGELALYSDGGWIFLTPVTGWRAWVISEAELLVFDGNEWRSAGSDTLQDLTLLGLGATADASNPLLAKLNASLFTALETGSGGSGDLRFKLNKEASGNVLSLLFQDNYSTRAEVGLVGDDDFVFKVSPDGSSFHEGVRIDKDDGRVSFPSGASGLRPQLSANRTYYVNGSTGSDSNDGLSGGAAFAKIQKAINTVLSIDISIYNVTISVADGNYAENIAVSGPFVGSGAVTLQGNTATPANCIIQPASGNAITVQNNGSALNVAGFKLTGATNGVYALNGGVLNITGNMDFGTASTGHIVSSGSGSKVVINSSYTISDNSPRHLYALNGALISFAGAYTVTLSGTRSFSSSYALASVLALVSAPNITFVGTATSTKRYTANYNAIIVTGGGGASYFPGDVAGAASTGAYCV